MDAELVLKALMSLGLSEKDAKTYIFLSKRGPQRAEELAEALDMTAEQVYLCLRNLQSKGIVNVELEPAWFLALPFDKVLDLLVKSIKQEAQDTKENRDRILSKWQSCI